MHSPNKQADRELYQELILMMQTLIPFVATHPDAKEALEGFMVTAEALKQKIQAYDYTEEDRLSERLSCLLNHQPPATSPSLA